MTVKIAALSDIEVLKH